MIGGQNKWGPITKIAAYNYKGWTEIGELRKPKRSHGSLGLPNGLTMIYEGGDNYDYVEIWNLSSRRRISYFNWPHENLSYGFGSFIIDINNC